MTSQDLLRADDHDQTVVSTEPAGVKNIVSCVPRSCSLSTSSSIDSSNKNSLSSTITATSSQKNSFSGKTSDGMGSNPKSSKCKLTDYNKNEEVECGGSRKSSTSMASYSSSVSELNECTYSSFSSAMNKPHKANDARWEAIQTIQAKDGVLGLTHFRLLKRLGCGDIGSVYLAKLTGTNCFFAMKVMDKGSLEMRKKLLRAQTEREILSSLDHPFLPTLYSHFETGKFFCLVMEFCNGGDLHTLRQQQTGKHFSESAARFYASEVLLALEYLHMLGVVYRDLKPENVLVREDGHIMLLDFDLSLRCVVNPTVVKSASSGDDPSERASVYYV